MDELRRAQMRVRFAETITRRYLPVWWLNEALRYRLQRAYIEILRDCPLVSLSGFRAAARGTQGRPESGIYRPGYFPPEHADALRTIIEVQDIVRAGRESVWRPVESSLQAARRKGKKSPRRMNALQAEIIEALEKDPYMPFKTFQRRVIESGLTESDDGEQFEWDDNGTIRTQKWANLEKLLSKERRKFAHNG